MDGDTIDINLELKLADDCLSGSARNGRGASREFSGWLGLVAAIDALLPGARPTVSQRVSSRRRTRMLTADRIDVNQLRRRVAGGLAVPGDEAWDSARQAFNLAVDQRPVAVVLAESEDDVAESIRFAREHGLRVAPQTTGHNASAMETLEDSLLVKTTPMTGVEIGAAGRRVRARAGARWMDVTPRVSQLGLAALHGSSSDVGIVGYSLGGGMGWLARKHGLQANSVTAIELVTADGELVRADADHEPELFWALRGGGGNFGVVTAIEFSLYPVEELYAGALFFPLERAGEVLHAWRELLTDLPDEITSVGRVLRFPPLPEIPEPLRGGSYAIVEAAYLGGEADGAELLRPLRELGPAMDTFAMVAPVALSELHPDPPDPVPALSGHQLLDELPASAIDDVLAAVGGPDSSLLSFELRHMGGALARPEPGSGALDKLAGTFAMFAVGMPTDEAAAAAIESEVDRVTGVLAPWDAGRYLNFAEQPIDTSGAYAADTYRRLQAVKAGYDPDDLFRANHPIPPADNGHSA